MQERIKKMPNQYKPSEKVMEMIAQKGGSVWTSVTDMAVGSVAVARTLVEMHVVPDKARTLLGWRPIDCPIAGALAESSLVVFDIQGVNYNFQPQEVICGNVSGSWLGATGGILQSCSEYYDVFAPVAGGEVINVGAEPCDFVAGGRREGAEFTWTDVRLPLPTIKSLCSREIAIAAAGVVAGLAMPITDAHELIEVGGCATMSVATALDEINMTLILRCTAMPMNEIRVMLEPCGPVYATPGGQVTYVSRRCERMKFSQPSVTMTADWDLDILLAVAGQAVHYIRWI
jgi:hypothetical protein